MRAGVNVPPGFVLLCTAFDYFIAHNNFAHRIKNILSRIGASKINIVEKASKQIVSLILSGQIPDEIVAEVNQNYRRQHLTKVAVRSSATAEDGLFLAWAGQLETYINADKNNLADCIKKCWASLFTARAIFYRSENNLLNKKISVAVVVQKMIASDFAGVAFTANPVNGDLSQIVIESGAGPGGKVVSGNIIPSRFILDKNTGLIFDRSSKLHPVSDSHIVKLAKIAADLEKYFGYFCDIEWAIKNNTIYFLQCRPITALRRQISAPASVSDYIESQRWFIGIRADASLFFYSIKQDGNDRYVSKWHGIPFAETILVPIKKNYPIRVFNLDQTKKFHAVSLDKITRRPGILEKYIASNNLVWKLIEKQRNELSDFVSSDKYSRAAGRFFALLNLYEKAAAQYNIIFSLGLKMTENKENIHNSGNILIKHDIWRNSVALKEDLMGETVYYFIKYVLAKRIINLDPILVLKNLTFREMGAWLGHRTSAKKMINIVRRRKKEGCVYVHFRDYPLEIIEAKKDFQKIRVHFKKMLMAKNTKKGRYLSGQPVLLSDRFIKGKAILIKDKKDLAKKGNLTRDKIIVAIQTTPHYIPYAKNAKGIITDEGGITCHAAIIAREKNKPCIIGTKNATDIIKDGDTLEMHMQNGQVMIVRK